LSDIFLSYASADRPRVVPLVEALRKRGWSVWWDRTIPPGKTWDQVIESALADARCVVVLWSRNAIRSDWVRAEAHEARNRGILVPALLEDVTIPLAFRQIQAANLVDWSGGMPSAGLDELAGAVLEVLSNNAAESQRTEPTDPAVPDVKRKSRRAARLLHADFLNTSAKRLIVFGSTAVVLIGIAMYVKARVQQAAKTPSSSQNAGAAAVGPQTSSRVRENAKQGVTQLANPPSPAQHTGAAADGPPTSSKVRESAKQAVTQPAKTPSSAQHASAGADGPQPSSRVRENQKDGLTYIWIPPARFMMGCSPGDGQCKSDEKPPHPVNISKGFWMGKTEVTQEAYQRVMGQNPSRFEGAQRPVENVSWEDADDYCGKVTLRLPTEAEWEYAARAGTAGPRYGELDKIAWYFGNSGRETKPVGALQPNSFGLYDMLGNVWEWTADRYGGYAESEATDPSGPPEGEYRVLRGGSWNTNTRSVRVSTRPRTEPKYLVHLDIGFRCAGELR
jgi:formylglycine-generating enzyme required for sulfatase activity